jgi:hypothetical protein
MLSQGNSNVHESCHFRPSWLSHHRCSEQARVTPLLISILQNLATETRGAEKRRKLREYPHGEPFYIAFPSGKNRKYAPAVATTNQS